MSARKRKRVLGNVERWGATKSVTLIIGHDIGTNASTVADSRCKRGALTQGEVDTAVKNSRRVVYNANRLKSEPEKCSIGLTRVSGKGIYKGRTPEDASIYTVYHDGACEGKFAHLVRNIQRTGERLAEKLCQDSIIAVASDGRKSYSYGLTRKTKK